MWINFDLDYGGSGVPLKRGGKPRKKNGDIGFDDSNSYRKPAEFRILKQITVPPGLDRSGLRLVLPKGVPAPEGVVPGVCVVSEETSKGLTSGGC